MESGKEEQQIEQLKNLKRQIRWWKGGLFATGVLVVVTSIGTVTSAVHGLTDKGPKQDQFVKEMTTALKSDVVPMMEEMAKTTMNNVRPQIQASFERVNNRLPELAQATLSELDTLQANLPKRGEAVLTKTFGEMLTKKEDQLQKMFPEATEEQIERLLHNLAESSGAEAQNAAVELFGRHHEALEHIHANLEKMASMEKNLDASDPSWEMGLLVLDIFRDDLEKMRPGKDTMMASASTTVKSAQKAVKAEVKK